MLRRCASRSWLAAVLVLVLAVSGLGRGWAATSSSTEAGIVIGGIVVPICHSGPDGRADPGHGGQHDCCDACALCAPVTLAAGPDLTAPARAFRFATHRAALRWAPVFVRLRTPRLAQGPPAA